MAPILNVPNVENVDSATISDKDVSIFQIQNVDASTLAPSLAAIALLSSCTIITLYLHKMFYRQGNNQIVSTSTHPGRELDLLQDCDQGIYRRRILSRSTNTPQDSASLVTHSHASGFQETIEVLLSPSLLVTGGIVENNLGEHEAEDLGLQSSYIDETSLTQPPPAYKR